MWHGFEGLGAESVVSFSAAGGQSLALASNCFYEVWADGVFLGDGGHRCVRGEAFVDSWPEARHAGEITLRVHVLDPADNQVLFRALFDDPFLAASAGDWRCRPNEEVAFGSKLSAQLGRQCVVAEGLPASRWHPTRAVERSQWSLVPGPARSRHVSVAITPVSSVLRQRAPGVPTRPLAFAAGDGFAELHALVREPTCDLEIDTFDLGAWALHRFEVCSSTPCVLLYSEVDDVADSWSTRWRAKVTLADAFTVGSRLSPIGHRGCRYVHIARPRGAPAPTLDVQRREYPLTWRSTASAPAESLVGAVRANLVACVDGGLVDTCWRERAQWTGDARMSAFALRSLTKDRAPVSLALRQIAASYDERRGMVMGVAPIHNTQHDFFIPGFHLAFCLAAVEHDPTFREDPTLAHVVRDSMVRWRESYLRGGLLGGMPGWHFTDWDPEDARLEGEGIDPNRAQAIYQAWWSQLCQSVGETDGLDRVAFDSSFARPDGWALMDGDASPSLHATAAVAGSSLGASKRGEALAWLRRREDDGELARRMTPYFAYFVAAAYHAQRPADALAFVERFYGPIARRYGAFYERTHDGSSRAHGWSIGFARFLDCEST